MQETWDQYSNTDIRQKYSCSRMDSKNVTEIQILEVCGKLASYVANLASYLNIIDLQPGWDLRESISVCKPFIDKSADSAQLSSSAGIRWSRPSAWETQWSTNAPSELWTRSQTKKLPNNKTRWWHIVSGDESDLEKLEREWESVKIQTGWKLEKCYIDENFLKNGDNSPPT